MGATMTKMLHRVLGNATKAIVTCTLLFGGATIVRANTATFVLDNVKFSTGGTVTGSFTYNSSDNSLTNINLQASLPSEQLSATLTDGEFFTEIDVDIFEFDPVNAYMVFAVASPTSFTAPNPLVLTTSMITFNTPTESVSFSFTSGRLDPTPLPAALPLFATGLGGLGLLGWRRKRRHHAVA
jgi:hypothetical protein